MYIIIRPIMDVESMMSNKLIINLLRIINEPIINSPNVIKLLINSSINFADCKDKYTAQDIKIIIIRLRGYIGTE